MKNWPMKLVRLLAVTSIPFILATSTVFAADSSGSLQGYQAEAKPASEISASALAVDFKVFNPSPGYFSVYLAHFLLRYENQNIPWGSRVYLHYNGFDFKPAPDFQHNEWYAVKTLEMKATGPFQWSFDSNDPALQNNSDVWLARGMSRPKSLLKFDIQILLPDGQVIWDRGSDSELGYYLADTEKTKGCSIFSQFCPLDIEAVEWNGN